MNPELPDDLAKPRKEFQATFVANIVIGGVLFLITLGLLIYAVTTT